jgi:type VI secretion system protein ImpF
VSEEDLRAHVKAHLEILMNTVRLDAASDLDDYPHVARSVLNYGFQDMSNMTRRELIGQEVCRSVKQSLSDHEPRLVPGSIEARIQLLEGDEMQRLGLQVLAELIADPADIPVDYEADIDSGSGKVVLQPQGR